MDATKQDAFEPEERWASAYLTVLKTSSRSSPVIEDMNDTFVWCLEYAVRLQNKHGLVQLAYLDEVGRVSKLMGLSFLTFTALFNMGHYVRIKARTATDGEIKRIKNELAFTQWPEDMLLHKTALQASVDGDYEMTTRALNKRFWYIISKSRYYIEIQHGKITFWKGYRVRGHTAYLFWRANDSCVL